MRRLKFRLWHIPSQKILPWTNDWHNIALDGYVSVPDNSEEIDDYIIMQWTGLTDKYDGPIYEDDLVENESGRIFKVVWFSSLVTACWDLDVVTPNRGDAPGHYLWAGLKVIGNIHQNPELVSQ